MRPSSEVIYIKINMINILKHYILVKKIPYASNIYLTYVPVFLSISIPCFSISNLSFQPKVISFFLVLTYRLIAISNSCIINPGPCPSVNDATNSESLNIFYQNVQALIPFTDLNKPHPNLDQTKLLELQSYVGRTKSSAH